jgi:hypothetical protein
VDVHQRCWRRVDVVTGAAGLQCGHVHLLGHLLCA